LVWT